MATADAVEETFESKMAPGFTAEFTRGHKETAAGWVSRVQNFLVLESLVYLFNQQITKKAAAQGKLTRYFKQAVLKVKIPSEFASSKGKLLLVPGTASNRAAGAQFVLKSEVSTSTQNGWGRAQFELSSDCTKWLFRSSRRRRRNFFVLNFLK